MKADVLQTMIATYIDVFRDKLPSREEKERRLKELKEENYLSPNYGYERAHADRDAKIKALETLIERS